MGSDTTKSVNTSVVGVMMAATTSIATTACLLYVAMKWSVNSPMRPISAHTTGNSKTTPITRHMPNRVSMYDCSVSMLATSGLT